jgi:hypothetical protein
MPLQTPPPNTAGSSVPAEPPVVAAQSLSSPVEMSIGAAVLASLRMPQ